MGTHNDGKHIVFAGFGTSASYWEKKAEREAQAEFAEHLRDIANGRDARDRLT